MRWARSGEKAIRWSMALLAAISIFFNLGNYQNKKTFDRATLKEWVPFSIALPLNPIPGLQRAHQEIYSKSWDRMLYEQLADRVDENHRLLVTSSLFQPYPGRRVFQTEVYFGDNAVYLVDHSEPLDEVISKYNIKYVLFTTRDPKRDYLRRNDSPNTFIKESGTMAANGFSAQAMASAPENTVWSESGKHSRPSSRAGEQSSSTRRRIRGHATRNDSLREPKICSMNFEGDAVGDRCVVGRATLRGTRGAG